MNGIIVIMEVICADVEKDIAKTSWEDPNLKMPDSGGVAAEGI